MGFLNNIRWIILSYFIAAVYIVREWIGLTFGLSPRLKQKELLPQKGRLAIVTGGSRGIGLEIAKYLLHLECNVIIGSSSSAEARTKLENSLKEEYPRLEVQVCHLDLASLKSVSEFAKKFSSSKRRLHLLINNAGIMHVPRKLTVDGFESHFAVNYLSHFLLSLLLLPVMGSEENAFNARIINTSSCVHYISDLDIQDLQGKNYSKHHAYMQSKLAQIMFTFSLQSYLSKINSNVTVNCAHPGVTNTDLLTRAMTCPQIAKIFKSAKEGAETILYAAVSKEMENIRGKYLEDCRIVEPSKVAKNKRLQNNLWQQTLQYIRPWLTSNLYEELYSHINE